MSLTRDIARLNIDSDGSLHNTTHVGNVGIGTHTPGTTLQVAGTQNTPSGTSKGMLLVRDSASTHGMQMGVAGSAPWTSWIQGQDNNISTTYPISLQPGGGNVGIGTTNPSVALDVIGDLKLTNSANAVLSISDEIGEVGDGNLAFQAQNTAGSALKPMGFRAEDIRFATGSAERMRVSDNGVGIGTGAPVDKVVAIVGNGGGILQSTYDTGTATSGQKMGAIGFKGYASGNTNAAADAKIEGVADGAHSGTSAPGRLDFYTKHAGIGPGSGPVIASRITSNRDHIYYQNVNGWTVNAYDLTGGTYEYQCRKRFSTGSSASTQDVLRFKRHYWGSGSVRFDVRQTYYVTTEDNTFWLQGYGRNDASYNPTYSLGHTGNQNSSSGRLSLDNSGGSSSPGDATANYVDVQIYIPAYTQFYVTAYVAHSEYSTNVNSMSGANSFALF
tara:strand:+ start:52 stop:1383 length:1332 start_codon:yes stop_codon:yes gene_type:complete